AYVVLGVPSRDRASTALHRVRRGADEQAVAVVLRIAAYALGRARRARRLAAAAGWDALITVAAAHRIAAGIKPSRRRAVRCRPGAAAEGAAGSDAHALVLARAVDAPIHRAAVPVVAVEDAAAARPERRG